MRAFVTLGAAALIAAACISYQAGPTLAPTLCCPPTAVPTAPPTEPPTAPPTEPPTEAPTPTLAPGQTPLPTPLDLRPFLTSGVTLYNLGDTTLYATATGIDPDTLEEFKLGTYSVEPEQFTRQAAIPLRIRFDFSYAQDVADALGTCEMIVATGDEIDFVAVATGVVVTKNGVQPDTIAEMSVASSSLCTVPT